ncbi:cytochrome P450 [Amycolatopsis sp. NPDC051061]|uniref:cytochrome P450 n=1 Tax=Amycolatopsis sp. NPDC051061 TaxID=3155042 RepID=UPI003432DB2C
MVEGDAETTPFWPFSRLNALEVAPALARAPGGDPVRPVRLASGGHAWLVTGHDAAQFVLTDPQFRMGVPGLGTDFATSGDLVHRFLDPPDHNFLRKLVSARFSRQRVLELEPRMTEIASSLLDVIAEGGPPADLVERFALPFSIAILGEVLGVPPTRFPELKAWSDALISIPFADTAERTSGWRRLRPWLTELIAEKRRTGGVDVLSSLIRARDEHSESLTEEELLAFVAILIPPGYLLTSTVISWGVILLAGEEGLGHAEVTQGMVEEILRFQLAGGDVARVATEEVALCGTRVRAGDKVIVALSAVNRDSRLFTDPASFKVDRKQNAHLAFGHGIHYCLGAGLARVELQVALDMLFKRFPGIRLAEPIEELTFERSDLFGDELVTRLPVVW